MCIGHSLKPLLGTIALLRSTVFVFLIIATAITKYFEWFIRCCNDSVSCPASLEYCLNVPFIIIYNFYKQPKEAMVAKISQISIHI